MHLVWYTVHGVFTRNCGTKIHVSMDTNLSKESRFKETEIVKCKK